LTYCYYVAGSVGLMLIPILSPEEHEALKPFAIHLGYGMQITNILRDIGEDFKHQRIYLPKRMMAEANYSIDDLAHGIINSEFIDLFERLAQMAETYFKDALDQIDVFPIDSRMPLALSIILYRAILDACRANGYDVFSKKNYVSDEQKNVLIQTYLNQNKE
jgi:15-cis-phytoene synthase